MLYSGRMTLKLGSKPDSLELSYSPGYPWWQPMSLSKDGAPYAWPAAPELVFDNGTIWTATLTDGDTRALWDKTKTEVDALGTDGTGVKLVVGDTPYWSGQAIPNA